MRKATEWYAAHHPRKKLRSAPKKIYQSKERTMQKVMVKQSENKEDQVPVELLAESIREISVAITKLRKGPLREDALLLLIKQNCKPVGKHYPKHTISVKEIKETLRSIETLSQTFLR